MRCKNCDYPLWNLKARACPECGAPFTPSGQEFVINSVAFCCPQCDQDYYGTGAKGHIEPIEFDCVKCGRHIHMDEMVLRPTKGVTEERTQIDRSRGWSAGNGAMSRPSSQPWGTGWARPSGS